MTRKHAIRGFTLIEMLTVIGIIGVLTAIIWPVTARALGNARKAACFSNLRQLGQAVELYTSDYDNRFVDSDPLAYSANWQGTSACDPWAGGCSAPAAAADRYAACWQRSIFRYVKDNALYQCQSAKDLLVASSKTGYAINGAYWYGARKGYVGTTHKYAGDVDAPDTATAFDGYIRTTKVPDPSGTLMIMDSSPTGNYQVGEQSASGGTGREHPSSLYAAVVADPNSPERDSVPDFTRHNEGINCLFADGHAKWQNKEFVYEKSTTNQPDGSTYADRHWTMEQD